MKSLTLNFKKYLIIFSKILLFLTFTKGLGISFVIGLSLKPFPPQSITTVNFFKLIYIFFSLIFKFGYFFIYRFYLKKVF